MYLSNLDTTSFQQFFPLERPDYQIQYQDILFIRIITPNEVINNQLNPGDQLYAQSIYRDESSIYVFGYTVSDSGFITLPILGDISVIGLTIEDIKESIQERASLFVKDALVTVKLLSFKFTVIGEVNRPGSYTNYNNQLTVSDAIGMAGDITDYGNRTKVLIARPTKEGTIIYPINLQDKNLLLSEGFFLLPNDIVIVEPLKSKPFRLNIPSMTLVLATISTLILVLSFIQ
jgi:polysaccharide export outer membrane protein